MMELRKAFSLQSQLCPAECSCARGVPAFLRSAQEAHQAAVVDCASRSVQQYLSEVYPTAAQRFLSMSNTQARAFFDGLDFYYNGRCDERRGCKEDVVLIRWLYGAWLPCWERPLPAVSCLAQHYRHYPQWANQVAADGWAEVEHRAFGLGLPPSTMPNGGKAPPRSAAEFMDAGPAGMWYVYRRGSGIFLRLGRTLSAPGKNAMFMKLLEEIAQVPALDNAWKSMVNRQKLFWVGRSGGAHEDAIRMRLTANGSKTCKQVDLRYCRCKFILGDMWDDSMTWAGRVLRYDTLIFTATLIAPGICTHPENGTRHDDDMPYFNTAYPEIVDLRMPRESWLAEQQEGVHRFLSSNEHLLWTYRKKPAIATAWVQEMRSSGLLTLRDPFALNDVRRARACTFSTRHFTLQCKGHLSAAVAKGWGQCGTVMCGQHMAWIQGRPELPSTKDLPVSALSRMPISLNDTVASALLEAAGMEQPALELANGSTAMQQLRSDVRVYLQRVYPAAKLLGARDSTLLALFTSLHFYYGDIIPQNRIFQANAIADTNHRSLPFDVKRRTCMQPDSRTQGTLRNRFVGLLPCSGMSMGGRGGCLQRQHLFRPEWVSNATTHGWIEIQHAAFGNKHEVGNASLLWVDMLDPGPAGMWFHYARGSGIFYRAGRVCAEPSKNAALSRLLVEAAMDPAIRSEWPPAGLAQLQLAVEAHLLQNMSLLAARVLDTSLGKRTCKAAGLAFCRAVYILGDEWDSLIVWLGRALGYDTIFLFASLCCGARPSALCGVSELVDLRIPKSVRDDPVLNRSLFRTRSPEALRGHSVAPFGSIPSNGPKTGASLGYKWMSGLRDSRMFTLRDPLDIGNDDRAKPCRFLNRPRPWLACREHPSMALAGTSVVKGR